MGKLVNVGEFMNKITAKVGATKEFKGTNAFEEGILLAFADTSAERTKSKGGTALRSVFSYRKPDGVVVNDIWIDTDSINGISREDIGERIEVKYRVFDAVTAYKDGGIKVGDETAMCMALDKMKAVVEKAFETAEDRIKALVNSCKEAGVAITVAG